MDFDTAAHLLRETVLQQPGALDSVARAVTHAGGGDAGPLEAFAHKVATKAYTVTDDDVAALRDAGWTEDQIFEACVCAAVGAGLSRLERGMRVLGDATS